MKKTVFQLLCRRSAVRAYSVPPFSPRDELTSRKLPLAFDYLHPQPSHLLNLTLSGLLSSPSNSHDTTLPSIKHRYRLPAGHHLVYFPPQIPLSQLLPDGTDDLHSPGGPFTRRLWAGGRVRFADSDSLRLKGDRAVCLESIRDVVVKGKEPDEKVIVKIERRMGVVDEGESEDSVRGRLFQQNEDEFGDAVIIEDRNIVFMRGKTPEQISYDKERFGDEDRIIRSAFSILLDYVLDLADSVLLKLPQILTSAILSPLPKLRSSVSRPLRSTRMVSISTSRIPATWKGSAICLYMGR